MSSDQQASPVPSRISLGEVGQSAPCVVSLAPTGLVIVEAGGVRRDWPFEAVKSAVPLSGLLDDVLLTSKTEPGVTIHVTGRELIDGLAVRAPTLRAGATRLRWAMPGLGVAGAIGSIIATCVMLGISVASIDVGSI